MDFARRFEHDIMHDYKHKKVEGFALNEALNFAQFLSRPLFQFVGDIFAVCFYLFGGLAEDIFYS